MSSFDLEWIDYSTRSTDFTHKSFLNAQNTRANMVDCKVNCCIESTFQNVSSYAFKVLDGIEMNIRIQIFTWIEPPFQVLAH